MTENREYLDAENRIAPQDIERELQTDSLTGMLTIPSFREAAGRVLESLRQEKREKPLDVVFFNIESFKSYNEKYGFEAGNQLILKLGRQIAEVFPERIIARMSGDQFTALVYEAECRDGVLEIHRRFSRSVMGTSCSLKIGIASMTDDIDISTACDRAKIAADSIKKKYLAIYRYFDSDLENTVSQQRYVVDHIDEAIEKNRIRVFYQPVVRTLTREVCGVEALTRWEDPQYGLMAPDILIGTLEEYQRIHKLDSAMIRLICQETSEAIQAGEKVVPFSFNLSWLDFELCDIFRIIEENVNRYHIPKNMVHVEITESVLNKNPELIRQAIHKFHASGYEVWMDDFGSGYSSLNILKDYDFDVIKIDMLFLRKFDERSKNIIASIVDMAKRLGIRTLAEGVETEEQLNFLRDIGCEKAQGYLIGKPLPILEMRSLLKREKISFEEGSMRQYYDDLGRVNLLSTRPLDSDLLRTDEKAAGVIQGIPLAIWELQGDMGRFLLTNSTFRDVLKSIGVRSPRAAEFDLNDREYSMYDKSRSYLKEMRESGSIVTIDEMVNGNYVILNGRNVSCCGDRSAYVLVVHNVSEHAGYARKLHSREALNMFCRMFEMVDVFSPRDEKNEPIYIREGLFQQGLVNRPIREIICNASKDIAPEDRKRFLEFLNPDNVQDRLECTSGGSLTDYFRQKNPKGHYVWKEYNLFLLRDKGEENVLLCIRETGADRIIHYEEPLFGAMKPRVAKDLHVLTDMNALIS